MKWVRDFIIIFVTCLTIIDIGIVHCQTKFSICSDHQGRAPDQVYLNDCIEQVSCLGFKKEAFKLMFLQPCNLQRGTNGSTTIVFTPHGNFSGFVPEVKGTYFIFTMNKDLGDQGIDGCKYLTNGSCPLTKEKQVTHEIVDEISANEYLVKGVRLTYKLLAATTKEVLTCFEIVVNIIN